jgi:hypothetical protein
LIRPASSLRSLQLCRSNLVSNWNPARARSRFWRSITSNDLPKTKGPPCDSRLLSVLYRCRIGCR